MTSSGQAGLQGYATGMAATMQLLLGLANPGPPRNAGVPQSIPLTVVTGFLGAGKTTLLNAVLGESHGRRVAVIVNDFGSIEVDATLVRQRTEHAISLSNGCVCCSLAAGLSATLGMLVQQAEPPDAILLEASGIAEPDGIVHAALQHREIRLNAIIGILDSERTPALLRDSALRPLLQSQVARADLVLLNKIGVATEDAIDETEHWARSVAHPKVRIVRTNHSRLPMSIVLGEPQRRSFLLADSGVGQHEAMFEACTLDYSGSLDPRLLADMLGAFPDGILRAKGLVCLHGSPARFVAVQVAGRRWSLTDVAIDDVDAAAISRMVAIGRRGAVDREALQLAFVRCAAPAL